MSTFGLGAQISSATDSGNCDLLLLSTIVMATLVVCREPVGCGVRCTVWRRRGTSWRGERQLRATCNPSLPRANQRGSV